MTRSEFQSKYGKDELAEYEAMLRELSPEERAALAGRLDAMASAKRAEIADLEAELGSILEDADAMRLELAPKEPA